MADPNFPSDELARQIAQLKQRRDQLLVKRAVQMYKLTALENEGSVLQEINIELKLIYQKLQEKIKQQDAMNEEMRNEIDFWRTELYEAEFLDDTTDDNESTSSC